MTFDDGGLSVNVSQAPQATPIVLQKWMTRVVQHVHQAVARNIGDGGLIGRRSGNLARAIVDLVTVTSDGATGAVWPDPAKAPYGAIQESGGTIVPTRAQALAIPLPAMLTGNGVARGTAAQVRDNPAAFGFKATFIPKGHDVIMGTLLGSGSRPKGLKGHAGDIVPLFALKPSVTIPGRHYLDITLRQELTWIADQLEQLTGDIVRVTFGGDEAYA